MKLVIGTKEGKTYNLELTEEQAKLLNGKRIGDVIAADMFGLGGYELKLTGGSNGSGFGMRKSVSGVRKVKALLSSGPGYRPKDKGARERKTVEGNSYSERIVQVNCIVVKAGAKPLNEIAPSKKKEDGEKSDAR